ncbi:hypothetical protein EYC84_011661 [Monilinia fructicola]|uniref:Inosine/uridine-preferring nucleoside hydrolase domain-containing protein n=1 Tax=Monilinia fructicola TaxID=38448 RepID=A0A5M9J3Q0_MONFR|nr:hypothetical protein EYC84_011661 [Monilinia fructicola]
MSSNNSPAVPNGLKAEQIAIYQEIIRAVKSRPKDFEIPHVLVITDIGKDYDDLTAMMVLKELHRLGAIKLQGFIANLAPAYKRVILQGAYHLESDPNTPHPCDPKHPLCSAVLKPEHVANNDWNWPDAEEFHAFLDQQRIPSVVYTRNAAFETPLTHTIFKDLAATGHRLGVTLYDIEKPQNLAFYAGACRTPPALPGRDQEWFLANRSTFYENHPQTHPLEPDQTQILRLY